MVVLLRQTQVDELELPAVGFTSGFISMSDLGLVYTSGSVAVSSFCEHRM